MDSVLISALVTSLVSSFGLGMLLVCPSPPFLPSLLFSISPIFRRASLTSIPLSCPLKIQTGFYLLNLGNRETRLERATVAVSSPSSPRPSRLNVLSSPLLLLLFDIQLLLLIMLARTGCDVSGAFRVSVSVELFIDKQR